MKLSILVGSGRNIGLLALPFVIAGIVLNVVFPSAFSVGGPPTWLAVASGVLMIPGLTIWIWSVALILTRIPRKQLITSGPYALVKHPLYTGVALLVLPWLGFLLDTWLGALIGAVVYIGSRIFAPQEERILAKVFGPAWEEYRTNVLVPWL
jgi:protein-S-isoprenylcysteine O-methyltransferase Ste14